MCIPGGPDAPHWKKLAEIPYTSEIWRKKYPSLAGVSTDFQNPQDPDFPINPANVVLEHNVVIHRDACLGEIAESLYEYNKIGVNYLFKSVEEAGFRRETLKFHSPPADFPEIPVEKIPGTASSFHTMISQAGGEVAFYKSPQIWRINHYRFSICPWTGAASIPISG